MVRQLKLMAEHEKQTRIQYLVYRLEQRNRDDLLTSLEAIFQSRNGLRLSRNCMTVWNKVEEFFTLITTKLSRLLTG